MGSIKQDIKETYLGLYDTVQEKWMHILKVPTGGFSLIRNFQDHDIQLLATTTNLLIDDRMHPALQFLFLEAAREINGKASFFADRGEFPFLVSRAG